MQPTPGAELADGNVIDKALADVRGYNARHPEKPLSVRLRVWGGFKAPPWVLNMGGQPIHVVHKQNRRLGRFWSPEYRRAWADLQKKLAARYDSSPLIREVSLTSCMSFTAEPFFLPGEESVQKPIREAGFTEAAYGDAQFTMGIMRDCRKRLGVRCVFDNHNLDTDLPQPLKPLYALMKQLGPEIVFQTFVTNPKDFEGTIKMGVAYGATSIELWQDYRGFPLVPNEDLRRWAAMVERNTSP